ncbi:MAG: hypothetical protein IJZ25_03225 [Lachnospiraceae bacterium]|nr:hypothetical protein [Lachnospiraceae bacterium]
MKLMKKMKKAFAIVLATALMIPSTGIVAGADETATTAYISFADSAWAVQSWNGGTKDTTEGVVNTNAEVTGYGQYTVSVDVSGAKDADGNALTATDLAFMDVEIANGEAAYPNSYMTIDSVKVNGTEVELASATYTSSDDDVVTRTNLFNEWVSDATTVKNARTADGSNEGISAAPVDKAIGAFTTIEVTFTLGEGVLCNGSDVEAVLSEESYPAFIAIGADKAESGDWGIGYYGADVEGVTAVNGELKSGETTTLSLTFDEPVLYTWFVAPCMVIDNPTWVSKEQSTFDVKVYLDGVEVTPDMSAGDVCWDEATGDYATNCLRIAGGYNEWGTKYLAESPAGFSEIKFEITPQIYIAEPVDNRPEFDPEGTYHAYIGFQTPKYSFRNAWDDADYGMETDFFNQVTAWDEENNSYSLGGTFVDAEITGNGTYTVSVSDFGDWTADFAEQDYFNLLFISSDLPNREEVVISDLVLKMDGTEVATFDAPFLDEDSPNYQKVLFQNIYNKELEALPYYAVPTKSIEITFTVSGFTNDAVVETPDDGGEETPEATPTTAPADDKKDDAAADTSADTSKEDKDGGNTGLIIGIVAAVVVVVGAVAVVAKKKKK